MKDFVQNGNSVPPILLPYEPEEFWGRMRQIIREEIASQEKKELQPVTHTLGLTYKPLYKIQELCQLFQVSKPTIYDWIRIGKLKPVRISTRVFFLWQDIQQLLQV